MAELKVMELLNKSETLTCELTGFTSKVGDSGFCDGEDCGECG